MRVILHIDMDAFYTQVEHVRLDIPYDVPLGILVSIESSGSAMAGIDCS